MKILFVAMSESIHTARWIAQLSPLAADIHLFPSIDCGVTNKELKNTTVHHAFHAGWHGVESSTSLKGIPCFSEFSARGANLLMNRFFPGGAVSRLVSLVRRLKPDVIHSLEFQHGAYLTLEAKKRLADKFPPWIVTNWGSDIYLFGRLPEHEVKIRDVLGHANFYSCECRRDVCLAKAFGFEGEILPVLPNTGGFDLVHLRSLRASGPVSDRRIIMLKGYQTWAGRALAGLRALERCADILDGYTLMIYSASYEVEISAKLFMKATGVPVKIIPPDTSHLDMLSLHGKARLSIGLSIGDAISTSFLEALVMGSFPIQSWTSCADEWVEDGVNGLLVPPEDPDIIEQAIRRALTDNDLVDKAAVINAQLALEKLESSVLSPQVSSFYKSVVPEKISGRG